MASARQNVEITGLAEAETYYVHFVHVDLSGNASEVVTTAAITTPDLTAPVLSDPLATATSETTADLSVSTTEGNGTLYFVVTGSGTAPTAAQIRAGQDHTGASASDSGSQAVSVSGVQSESASGLTAQETYHVHFLHDDAAGNASAIVTAAPFTTPDLTAPVLSSPTGEATGTTTADVSVTTDEAGPLYVVLSESATAPTGGQVEAGQDHTGAAAPGGTLSVAAPGVQTISVTGLSWPTSTYYPHFVQRDAAGNRSEVVSGAPIVAPPFSDVDQFGVSDSGFIYDFSDKNTLFTDLAGTTPVTASLDPIGYVQDKSGKGNHRAAPFTSARPTYTEGGGLAWAAMGASDSTRLELLSAASGLSSVDDLTLIVGYTTHASVTASPFTMGNTGSGDYARINNGVAVSSYRYGTGSELSINNVSVSDTSGAARVVTEMKRGSDGLHYVDGTLVETDTGLGTWAVDLSTAGALAAIRGDSSKIFYIAAINKSLSDEVLSDWHDFVKAKAGVA